MTAIISNLELADLNLTPIVVDNPIGADNPPLLIPSNKLTFVIDATDNASIPTQQVLESADFGVNWQSKLTDIQLDTLVMMAGLLLIRYLLIKRY